MKFEGKVSSLTLNAEGHSQARMEGDFLIDALKPIAGTVIFSAPAYVIEALRMSQSIELDL